MSKRTEFNTALKEAMKNKEEVALSTIRLILAALKDRDITAKSQGNMDGVEENEILSMLQSMIKQRQESIKTYNDAGRSELAEREEQEIAVIERFLPAQMGDDEIASAIDAIMQETGASDIKDMGKIMAVLKEKYAGQLDMGKAGGIAKQRLS